MIENTAPPFIASLKLKERRERRVTAKQKAGNIHVG